MQAELARNFFELFGLPMQFDLDTTALAGLYRDLQRRYHPDRFAAASEPERRLAMQVASHVNEAYQTLRDPLTRGRYLLRLRGVDTGEETDSVMSPAFLMSQMELREELDEAKRASDRASRIARIGETLRQSMDERLAQLREALAQTDSAGGQRARALVRELQFLRKVQSEVELAE